MQLHARRRSSELFPTDSPVAAQQLIGRSAIVESVTRSLDNGVNQVLIGPRRTGKTSVCLAALESARAAGLYVVTVDLFAVSGTAELAERLVEECIANRGVLARSGHAVRRAGRNLASALSVTATSKLQAELGDDVEIGLTPGLAARDPERALDYALRLPQRIGEKDDVQVALFLDEFQEIAHPRGPFGDPDALTKRMRSVLQDSDRVTSVFSGSVAHLMTDLFTGTHRAFFRFGQAVHLPEIADEDWLDGLTARYAEDGVTADRGALTELLTRTGGHPRSTMLVAQQAHLVLLGRGDSGAYRLDRDAVAEGWYSALAADSIGHAAESERIRDLGVAALDTAKRLARGEKPYGPQATRGAVNGALARLLRLGVVDRAERGSYAFTDPLFAAYLSRL